jgi:sugar lactone lactonase YvrE
MAEENSTVVARGGSGLCGLAFLPSGHLLACSSRDGRVLQHTDAGLTEWGTTSGSPSGLAVDRSGAVLVADLAHGALLEFRGDGSGLSVVCRDFERTPLRGPHSVALDAATGAVFFTDAGPEGDTGLHNPVGSVFMVTGGGAGGGAGVGGAEGGAGAGGGGGGGAPRQLRPLALRCLAQPTGVALAPGGGALFVAEAAANRLLRFTQRPQGVWHAAVFFQFSGRLGPSAIAVDGSRELLYVARPEAADQGGSSVIAVLNLGGELLKEFEVPGVRCRIPHPPPPTPPPPTHPCCPRARPNTTSFSSPRHPHSPNPPTTQVGPDVTSVALSPDGDVLFVAEASSSSVVGVRL